MLKSEFIRCLSSILALVVAGCASSSPHNETTKARVDNSLHRNSSASDTLLCQVLDIPVSAQSGQTISFKVRVQNISRKTQILPIREEVELCTSSHFIADAPAGEFVSDILASGRLLSGDYAISRNSMSTCPPQFDHLKPDEIRVYQFRWKPQKTDHGTGALRITLPHGFPELRLQPMEIIK